MVEQLKLKVLRTLLLVLMEKGQNTVEHILLHMGLLNPGR